jgi:hypothetical protein
VAPWLGLRSNLAAGFLRRQAVLLASQIGAYLE